MEKILYKKTCNDKTAWSSYIGNIAPPDFTNAATKWVSPVYKTKSGICGFQISMSTSTSANLSAMLYSDNNYTILSSMEVFQNRCQSFLFEYDSTGLESIKARLILFFSRFVNPNDTIISISSTPCTSSLSSVSLTSKSQTSPNFKQLDMFENNICSMALMNRQFYFCDWWNMDDGDSANFEIMEDHDCVKFSANTENDKRFLGISSKKNMESNAIMFSPIIPSNMNHVKLEFWHIFKCTNNKIKVYLTPTTQPLYRAIANGILVETISEDPTHASWVHNIIPIDLPQDQEAYHVC